jgi:hypothetical protein
MRGGEQSEANAQSAGNKRDSANVATSQLGNGEVQTWYRQGERKHQPGAMEPAALGEQRESDGRAHEVVGGGMRGRSRNVNRGDLAVWRHGQESEGP